MNVYDQILSLFAAKHKFLSDLAVDEVSNYEKQMHIYLHENHPEIIKELKANDAFNQELEEKLKKALTSFSKIYIGSNNG